MALVNASTNPRISFDQKIKKSITIKKKACDCNRILSVDDELFNQEALGAILSAYGLEIVQVCSKYHKGL